MGKIARRSNPFCCERAWSCEAREWQLGWWPLRLAGRTYKRSEPGSSGPEESAPASPVPWHLRRTFRTRTTGAGAASLSYAPAEPTSGDATREIFLMIVRWPDPWAGRALLAEDRRKLSFRRNPGPPGASAPLIASRDTTTWITRTTRPSSPPRNHETEPFLFRTTFGAEEILETVVEYEALAHIGIVNLETRVACESVVVPGPAYQTMPPIVDAACYTAVGVALTLMLTVAAGNGRLALRQTKRAFPGIVLMTDSPQVCLSCFTFARARPKPLTSATISSVQFEFSSVSYSLVC